VKHEAAFYALTHLLMPWLRSNYVWLCEHFWTKPKAHQF